MVDKNDIERRKRLITDDDAAMIVEMLEKKLEQRFFSNFGRGVWGLIWRAAVVGLLALAAYGHYKGP